MINAQIARAFDTVADILSLKGDNPFKIRAYQRAAQTLMAMPEDVQTLYASKGRAALEDIPGIGKDLADKMEEMINTGALAYLTELEKDVPKGLLEITGIQGMGPKKTKFVWETFKVTTVDELEALARSGTLNTQKGWGDTSVQNVLTGIQAMRLHNERVALPAALAVAEQILAELRHSGLCEDLSIAGSLRRCKETIGDIDILVTSLQPQKVMDIFCAFGLVDRILARGPTRASVHLRTGINADLRVVEKEAFGAALLYFTGSKEHNIRVRTIANDKGYTINEYGIYHGTADNKGKRIAVRTEQELYKAVGLPYIPPEMREDRGEIQLAQRGALPTLIEVDDMTCDLHLHSNFSDGSATLIDMARAAKAAGLSTIAICDHASPMGMVYGIKEHNIGEYLAMVQEARNAVKGLHILAGTEVDILEDGSLYLPDHILQQLDWVVASVHGNFALPREHMTQRILRALHNPYVRVFAHPTSRLLLKRDPIDYDVDKVFRTAAANNVALEINASIQRLDLNDVLARKAKEAGCMITINSDAHHPREFNYRFGITQARRAWLEKKDVLNTFTYAQLRTWMKKKKM